VSVRKEKETDLEIENTVLCAAGEYSLRYVWDGVPRDTVECVTV
jgi:hypothetical protein